MPEFPAVALGPIFPSGNSVIALGDSITFITCDIIGDQRGAQSWFSWAALLSDSQIGWLRNAGVIGNTTTDMARRIQADVIAYNPRFCIIHGGTNDAYVSAFPLATFAGNVRSMVAQLRAARITPVLTTVLFRSDAGALTAANTLIEQYNAWLRVYARTQGIKLLPFCEVLLDPTTGITKPVNTSDGLHPSAAGAQILGQTAADGLAAVMPPWTPPLAQHSQAWAINQLANGLFLANAAGLGTGFVIDQGTGTGSIVAGVSPVLGNWQKLAENPHTNQTVLHGPLNTVVVNPGDRLAFCGRFQSSCTGTDSAAIELLWWPGGTTSIPVFNFPGIVAPHVFYTETVAPAGTTGFGVYMILPAGAAGNDFGQMAQVTVLNLTAAGIATLL